MPAINAEMLKALVLLCSQIVKNQSTTKMGNKNLAICIGSVCTGFHSFIHPLVPVLVSRFLMIDCVASLIELIGSSHCNHRFASLFHRLLSLTLFLLCGSLCFSFLVLSPNLARTDAGMSFCFFLLWVAAFHCFFSFFIFFPYPVCCMSGVCSFLLPHRPVLHVCVSELSFDDCEPVLSLLLEEHSFVFGEDMTTPILQAASVSYPKRCQAAAASANGLIPFPDRLLWSLSFLWLLLLSLFLGDPP